MILTAGSDGSQGAGVSVDYGSVPGLTVIGFMSTEGGALPILPGATTDTGTRIQNINSAALPPYVGAGLTAGQSHQLGTVTFRKGAIGGGTFEIRSDADGPTDAVLDLEGRDISAVTTFNSAYLVNPWTFPTPTATASAEPTPTATSEPIPTATSEPTAAATATAEPTVTFTASPTPTPPITATPSAEPTPSAPPRACSDTWPQVIFVTLAKGQSPTNNAKLMHTIQGHIIEPESLRDTAHRIPVCAGTAVHSAVTDATGTPTNTASGSADCDAFGCTVVVNEMEKYQSISADGRDKDSNVFLPQ